MRSFYLFIFLLPLTLFSAELKLDKLGKTHWDNGATTVTNESRLDIFQRYLENLEGGVYIGVGSIQNFTLACWAHADEIYMIDFTSIVVKNNLAHIAFLQAAKSRIDYISFWHKNYQGGLSVLKKKYRRGRKRIQVIRAFKKSRYHFRRHFVQLKKAEKKYNYQTYLSSDSIFACAKSLAKNNKIHSLPGNLLSKGTYATIGPYLKNQGKQVSVLYLSNAEEYKGFWPFSKQYQKNIHSLPAKKNAKLLRTFSLRAKWFLWAPGSKLMTPIGFHYIIGDLTHFQRWMSKPQMNLRIYMQKAGITYKNRGYTYMVKPQ